MYNFLDAKDQDVFNRVRNYFKEKIEILYGNQDSALIKIAQGSDRKCLLLSYSGEDVGLLAYKKELNHEYGLRQAFEIKTLFVINPEKNSGRKIATHLLFKASVEALKKHAKYIFVTASSQRPEVIQFFLKRGFKIKKSLLHYHDNDSTEFLLVHNSPALLFFNLTKKLSCTLKSSSKAISSISLSPISQIQNDLQ
ncbi:MAG: hypothetical protein JJU12_05790 [Chlamydiales bacterium]|nr:hypothetical protein [Chlamydiales bacterium]